MARIRVQRKVVYAKTASLTTSSTTSAKIFELPAESIPVRVACFTTAASTGATLNVGTASDDNAYVSALDVSGADLSEGTLLNITKLTKPTDIYANIGGSPSSGGPFTIIMEFITYKSTGPK